MTARPLRVKNDLVATNSNVRFVPNPDMLDLHRHRYMRQFFVVAKGNLIVAASL